MKRDANKLLLEPLKEMYKSIKQIKKDPVEAVQKAIEEDFIKQVLLQKKPFLRLVEKEKDLYETTKL